MTLAALALVAVAVGALQPPPIIDARKLSISYKELASRAAEGVTAALEAGHRRVSVEIPQISSADRSTIARRFEDDNNWLLALAELLGAGKNPASVGSEVGIMQGGFEGGGDYLSDEGLYGYSWRGPRDLGMLTAVGNSEVGSSALSDLKSLDDGSGRLLLFNLGLDRLSFFDKIGLPSFDDVQVAYLLRRVCGGAGFLSRQFPGDFCVWRVAADGWLMLVRESPSPISPRDVDAAIRR